MLLQEQKHAIVIGGSIAGLLAARVLSDHFEQVTIVERDALPNSPEPRHGVSQSPHAHILLTRGYQILESFFEGLGNQLASQGAISIDWLAECPVLFPSGWGLRSPSTVKTFTCSRNLLEFVIRQRIESLPNVQWLYPFTVTQLVAAPEQTKLSGIQIKDTQGQTHVIPGQLVVDASGRTSRAPQWLEQLGYSRPQETIIDSGLGYASRIYERPTAFSADWKNLYVMAQAPEHPHFGALFQQEGNRWLVTLMGINHHYPPTDEAGFLNYARCLRSPIIYETIKHAKPLSDISSYRGTANRQRHYESMAKLPHNFISIGDSVCAFNPVYGQGMTIATQSALILKQHLECQGHCLTTERGRGFSKSFHQRLASVYRTPWLMATGEDLRWPQTRGAQPDLLTKTMQWYIDQVVGLNSEKGEVNAAFLEVIHMLKPPHSLLRPKIIMNMLSKLILPTPSSKQAINAKPTIRDLNSRSRF